MYTNEDLKALLNHNGYEEKDVQWIGSHDGHFAMTVTAFLEQFGSQYSLIENRAYDLVITLRDGSWFELEEGGGEQFWVLRKRPQRMPNAVIFDTYESIGSIDHQSMADVNRHSQA